MSQSPQSLTELTITGACVGVGIDESAQLGIVITGLEVVEGGFSVLGLSMQCLRWFRLYPDEITKYRLGRDQGDIAAQNLMRIILECCGILVYSNKTMVSKFE